MEPDGLTKEDRKKAARDAKRNQAKEKAADLTEYEEYNIKKKAQSSQHDEEVKRQQEEQRQKKAKEQKAKQEQLQAEQGGVMKLSKPEPALNPFQCFKRAHPKWADEKLKEEWAGMDDEKKAEYKALAQQDKQRYQAETAEWQKDAKKAQTSGKKGKQRM